MRPDLSVAQLLEIERDIEEIDRSLDILDPSNSIETQQIEAKADILRSYISLLRQMPRTKLRLVS